jgi:hypothetical protein
MQLEEVESWNEAIEKPLITVQEKREPIKKTEK